MIFQIHEKHGKHIAYSPNEAQSNEKNGWRTVSKEEFYGVPSLNEIMEVVSEKIDTEALEKDKESHEALKQRFEKTFGKKPHHRMKPETIIEKLNADSE